MFSRSISSSERFRKETVLFEHLYHVYRWNFHREHTHTTHHPTTMQNTRNTVASALVCFWSLLLLFLFLMGIFLWPQTCFHEWCFAKKAQTSSLLFTWNLLAQRSSTSQPIISLDLVEMAPNFGRSCRSNCVSLDITIRSSRSRSRVPRRAARHEKSVRKQKPRLQARGPPTQNQPLLSNINKQE